MKNKAKKVSIICLTVFLAVFLFTGCSGKNADLQTEPSPAPEPSVAETPTVVKPSTVFITEIMTSNKSVIYKADGRFPDWIELTNYGTEDYDITGFHLSDDPDEPNKWTFPHTVLSPGEIVVFFCDADASDDSTISFALNKEGSFLGFTDPQGNTVQTLDVPPLREDQSYCIGDGSAEVTFLATPGYSNDETGYELFLDENEMTGDLIINEVCVYNDSFHQTGNAYYDWVELKNVSSEPINLSEYSITDSLKSEEFYRLPDKTLKPGELYVVFCAGDEDLSKLGRDYVGFSLNAMDDQLFLFCSDRTLSDKAGLHDVPLGGTVGRLDGCKGFYMFMPGSPEKENSNGFRHRCSIPLSSVPAGRYNDIKKLTITLEAEGDIFYTLDGSEPSVKSDRYTGPITLETTAAVRAIAVSDTGLQSEIATYVYLINENGALPAVFLSADEFNAVYAEASSFCDANISYFGDDGEFCRNCKLELHGTSFKGAKGKKSYKVTFSDRFGGDLQYDVFGDGNASYHSLNIRGSYIDTAEMHLIRDSLVSLAANRICKDYFDPLALNSRYCTVYINGKYYGIFAIREAYSVKYASDHLGGTEDDYVIVRPPLIGNDKEAFTDLYNYILKHNMQDEESYSYVDKNFDLKSLAVWLCFESYYANRDSGNIRFVRNEGENGKWKTMLYDFDIAIQNENPDWIGVLYSDASVSDVCRSMLRSDTFKQLLAETASELQDRGLGEELSLEILDDLVEEMAPEISRDLKKWGILQEEYDRGIEGLRSCFGEERSKAWVTELKQLLRYSDEEMHRYFPQYY